MELNKGWEMQGYYPYLDPDSDWSWAINNFVVLFTPHVVPTSSFARFITHRIVPEGILLINLDIIYLDLEQE